MIKSTITARTYKAIYRLLDRVSPVPFDCGMLCDAACCRIEDMDPYYDAGERVCARNSVSLIDEELVRDADGESVCGATDNVDSDDGVTADGISDYADSRLVGDEADESVGYADSDAVDYEEDYEAEMAMAFLPGEEKIHDRSDPWLSWTSDHTDNLDYPESWNGRVFFAKCNGPEACNRKMRPIQCRTYPVAPHIDESGELHLVLDDIELPYTCPLVEMGEELVLEQRFLRATYTVWKKLITDPLIRDLVEADSRDRGDENVLCFWPVED